MTDQPATEAAPLFRVGQEVLVDEGPRGPHTIKRIEPGMIPSVGDDLEVGEEQGYWYEVCPDSAPAEVFRVPEHNLVAIQEDEAPSEATSAPENGSEPTSGVESPPSVLDRLRRAYAAGDGERETTIPIAPGRYRDLAAKYRPINWELRRKLQRKAQRTGDTGPEAEASFQAILVADACKSIMMRPESGAEYVELHTLIDSYRDGEPVRFDSRLAAILAMSLIGGETQGDICRLVFNDPGAFDVHMTQLTTWSTQVLPDDEDDSEGAADPT